MFVVCLLYKKNPTAEIVSDVEHFLVMYIDLKVRSFLNVQKLNKYGHDIFKSVLLI